MKLNKKKELAAKVLGVGKGRIAFVNSRLEEIKGAITRQDIKDLVTEGAIVIKEVKGRAKVVKRKHRRGSGNIRKRVNTKKKVYMAITRKLRAYILELLSQDKMTKEEYKELRRNIKVHSFKSKQSLKEHLQTMRAKK